MCLTWAVMMSQVVYQLPRKESLESFINDLKISLNQLMTREQTESAAVCDHRRTVYTKHFPMKKSG